MFTAGLTTSFKQQVLLGVHNLDTDQIRIALYGPTAVLDATTTVYTTSGEVSSSGYTAGGLVLVSEGVGGSNGTGYCNFVDPSWSNTTFTVRGALIYNATKGNKSIGVLNFGLDQVTLGQTFTIQFPFNNPETALIRIL
jgi:hypothetical protein